MLSSIIQVVGVIILGVVLWQLDAPWWGWLGLLMSQLYVIYDGENI